MPDSKVVDAWGIITWLLDQPAAPAVEWFIQQADAGDLNLIMSWMHVGEGYYIISRRHGPERADEFLKRLPFLPIRLVLPDEDGILAAAEVKAKHPVSFSDAFAIALAQAEKASVITGDDEIRQCGVVPVERPPNELCRTLQESDLLVAIEKVGLWIHLSTQTHGDSRLARTSSLIGVDSTYLGAWVQNRSTLMTIALIRGCLL